MSAPVIKKLNSVALILALAIIGTPADAQSQCEKSMRTGGSVLKGKTYEVEADFAGVEPRTALDRLAAGLPSREIELIAMDADRGLVMGRTNSAGQRPYSVELHVSASSGGSRGRLLLSLPFGAFASAGMASQLCETLSVILIPTEAESVAATPTSAVPTAVVTEVEPLRCPRAEQVISKDGAGGIRLGMRVAEARRALPEATFERTMDGDGMVLIEAKSGEELVMILYAGEVDYEAPIQESAQVEAIWVYSERYATSEGVCPGMLLDDAVRLLGGPPELMISEIESREYVKFPGQHSGFEFRTMGGIYPEGVRLSRKYEPSASIMSILIH